MPELDEWLTISSILFEFYELNPRFVKTTSHGYKKTICLTCKAHETSKVTIHRNQFLIL